VNSHFNSANPNFYSVLSFYRDEERLAYVKLLKYDQCKPNVERAKRDIVKDLHLADYLTMLISGEMNIRKYLEIVSDTISFAALGFHL
jgi:hypothetical protein